VFGKSFSTFLFKKALYGIALGGRMLLGSSGAAQAANGPVCDRRIAHERRELDRLRYECGYRDRWR
jgi:hypothetical protein